MAVVPSGGKDFPKAEPGIYLARIIDSVNLGLVQPKNSTFPAQIRHRIFWVLNSMEAAAQGKFLKTADGKWLTHMEEMPFKMTPPTKYQASRMYKLAEGVFGGADKIPMPFDDEYFIGRANQIVLSFNGQNSKYRTITSILPLPKSLEAFVPPVPEGFVRAKDRPAKQQGQTVATATAPASVAAPTQTSYVPEVSDEDIPF
jgi:hypothetical protein